MNDRKPIGYWKQEANCLNEARKFTSLSEFRKGAQSAYDSARAHGWLEGYTWLSRKRLVNGYWSRERCMEEARKYSTVKEFKTLGSSAYTIARNKGWFSDYTWLEGFKHPDGYWTEERCLTEGMKYVSRKEFRLSCVSAYEKSRKMGWIDKMGFKE